MSNGYVRQSAGTIVTNNTIQASDFNNEFNALLSAFDASAGHNHDGTTGGGAKISAGSLNGLTTITTGILSQTSATTFANRVLTGTTNRVTISNGDGVAGNPTFDISAAYVGQATITTLGTIGTGVWNGTVVTSTFGGTGVANTGTLTFSGSASVTGTNTGDQTTVSGNAGSATVLQTARNINGIAFNGSANITVTADASTLTNTTLNATIVTSSLTSVGTLTGGTWQATIISPVFGGTGVANAASQTTTRSGLFALTQTLTATTNVTYPTTGTLATLAGTETLTNKTLTNAVANTQTALDNSTKLATTAYVDSAVSAATGAVKAIRRQIITTSSTYTPDAHLIVADVKIVGGGGAGLSGTTATCGNGGGGAGEYAEGVFLAATIGASQTATIGTGGATSGASGSTTSLGALLTAVGGSGGVAGSASTGGLGGLGGTGGTGTGLHIQGGDGGTGGSGQASATFFTGGDGGTSFFGGGGRAGSGSTAAQAAKVYGAGGGGGGSNATAGTFGAGFQGVIVITEYCSA